VLDVVFVVFLVVAFATVDILLSPFVRIFDPTDETLSYPISAEQVPTYLLIVGASSSHFLSFLGPEVPG